MWYRCNISLLELTPEQFAVAVRRHWAIESSFYSGCGDEAACQILACTWYMAQNMLRAETSKKECSRKKQQIAGMTVYI